MTTLLTQVGEGWLHPERTPNGWKHVATFLILSLVVCVGALALGPYPITKFPDDTLYFLTQGDLLRKGYRPGVDYHTMHGPFPYLFTAAAMNVRGVSLEAVVLAQVLGAAAFGCMMFKIASRRVSALWAVFLAIAVELILISCTPVGSKTWREFTCAMWYNSMGYCIYAIVYLYLLVPARSPHPGKSTWVSDAVDSLIVALLLAGCFLTKYSYFVPLAIVFFVGTIILPRAPCTRLRGMCILPLAAAIAVGMISAMGGSLSVSSTLLHSLALKTSPILPSFRFVHYTKTISLFALGFFLAGWLAKELGVLRQITREGILVFLMFGSLLLAASLSAQDMELLPLGGVLMLGLLTLIVTIGSNAGGQPNKYLLSIAMAVTTLLLVHEPKNSLLSWFFSHTTVAITMRADVERYELSQASLAGAMVAPDVDPALFSYMPKAWMSGHLDALTLLKAANVTPDDVVFVASDVSPVNMLAGVKYPLGTVVWWPSSFIDVAKENQLIEKNLFSDVDFILRDTDDRVYWEFLMFHRGEYFEQEFKPVAKDARWILYARKKASAPGSTGG